LSYLFDQKFLFDFLANREFTPDSAFMQCTNLDFNDRSQPARQRDAAGFWDSHDSVKVFGTVLAPSGQKRWCGVAVKLESALE
jgi:hypothetical protein